MFVCLCNGYTDTQIREAAAGCAGAVDCVYEHLGAAPRCRGCVEMAGEIIADYRRTTAAVPATLTACPGAAETARTTTRRG